MIDPRYLKRFVHCHLHDSHDYRAERCVLMCPWCVSFFDELGEGSP